MDFISYIYHTISDNYTISCIIAALLLMPSFLCSFMLISNSTDEGGCSIIIEPTNIFKKFLIVIMYCVGLLCSCVSLLCFIILIPIGFIIMLIMISMYLIGYLIFGNS